MFGPRVSDVGKHDSTAAVQDASSSSSIITIHLHNLSLKLYFEQNNFDVYITTTNNNRSLANKKRPCDCSVLCLHPKLSLCSCSHCILDITSFGSADSPRRASNNGVGQFKPIFQVEGNTFRRIFFGYFIAD